MPKTKRETPKELIEALAKGISERFFEVRSHSDCEELKKIISRETGRYIGVTTLRRFFGIDKSSTSPGKYTMDTLAKLCGYSGSIELRRRIESEGSDSSDCVLDFDDIAELSLKSLEKIQSDFRLDSSQIISRKKIEENYAKFVNSSRRLGVVVAPENGGKTGAILGLISSGTIDLNSRIEIVMLADPRISSENGLSLESFLDEELSESTECSAKKTLDKIGDDSRMTVIVDGLEKSSKIEVSRIISKIEKFASSGDEFDRVKIILSLREQVLSEFDDLDSLEPFFLNAGLSTPSDESQSLLNFSLDEAYEIADAYLTEKSPAYKAAADMALRSGKLDDPLIYPPLLTAFFDSVESGETASTYLDLIIFYLKSKIYSGKFGEQKSDLIDKIIPRGIEESELKMIGKKRISDLLIDPGYSEAYYELLGSGILKEIPYNDEFGRLEIGLEIRPKFILYYFAVSEEIRRNGISGDIFRRIVDETGSSDRRATMIEIAVRFAFREKKFDMIFELKDYFDSLRDEFADAAQAFFVMVVREMRLNDSAQSSLLEPFAENEIWRRRYFKENQDIDFICEHYGDAFEYFEKIAISLDEKYLAFSQRLTKYIFAMERDGARKYVEKLNELPFDAKKVSLVNLAISIARRLHYYNIYEQRTPRFLLDMFWKIENIVNSGKDNFYEAAFVYANLMIAMNFARRRDITIYLWNRLYPKYKKEIELDSTSHIVFSKVLFAQAAMESGDVATAKRILESLNLDQIYRNRRIFAVYYQIVRAALEKECGNYFESIKTARKAIKTAAIMKMPFLEVAASAAYSKVVF